MAGGKFSPGRTSGKNRTMGGLERKMDRAGIEKRRLSLRCVTGVLLLALITGAMLSSTAVAEKRLEKLWLSVMACETEGEMPSGSVRWYKRAKDEYVLFLPGLTDWKETRLWFTGPQEIRFDGAAVRSGDLLSGLEADSEHTVQAGREKYGLRIMQGSHIGAAFVETATGSMKKVNASTRYREEGGKLTFLNSDGMIAYQGEMDHFKLRGNTSAELDKKNYGFKLSKSADLEGMGKAKRWVLIGNGRDLSLLRNQICMKMAAYAGLMYTPDVKPVDLYLNHAYYGCCLLSEKVEVHRERVNIYDLEKANEAANPEPLDSYPRVGEIKDYKKGKYKAFELANDPEDITGGYILEYENYQPRYGTELCAYDTARSKIILFKEPEIASVREMEYAVSFIQGYEDAIFSEDGRNPSTGKYYWEYIDFDSLVLKYMLEEVSMNTDGNGSSQYYFKPSDSVSKVFFAGPAWDYDATFASFSARDFQDRFLNPSKLLLTAVTKNRYYWPQLYAKEEFKKAVYEKWKSVYAPAMRILIGIEKDPNGQLRSLKEYASGISGSAEMNFVRWPISDGRNARRTGMTWHRNIEYLQGILERRYEALNQIWENDI